MKTRNTATKEKKVLTRSEQMRRVKCKDSAAERSLRSALHARGLRFRLQENVERVKVDILFRRVRLAVLVDGCFWHGCPLHATSPKTNETYWLPKLAENVDRDKRQTLRLEAAGWTVIRVWEHDCLPPSDLVVALIVASVKDRSNLEA